MEEGELVSWLMHVVKNQNVLFLSLSFDVVVLTVSLNLASNAKKVDIFVYLLTMGNGDRK